jgi:hypothetical protein
VSALPTTSFFVNNPVERRLVKPAEKPMVIVRIPQKMSGTGSIHDLASDLTDRDLEFPAGTKYAVVLPAYYGRGVQGAESFHRTEKGAAQACNKLADFQAVVIGIDGLTYFAEDDALYLEPGEEPYPVIKVSEAAAILGSRGGRANTPAQNAARAVNARKGGRPRKST